MESTHGDWDLSTREFPSPEGVPARVPARVSHWVVRSLPPEGGSAEAGP